MDMNPFDMMKNLQKMQEQLSEFQNELSGCRVTGSSGGGVVEVDMSGKMEVLAVRISREAWQSVDGGSEPDVEMLQDLIVAACAAANNKVRDMVKDNAQNMAERLGIPSMMMSGLANL